CKVIDQLLVVRRHFRNIAAHVVNQCLVPKQIVGCGNGTFAARVKPFHSAHEVVVHQHVHLLDDVGVVPRAANDDDVVRIGDFVNRDVVHPEIVTGDDVRFHAGG